MRCLILLAFYLLCTGAPATPVNVYIKYEDFELKKSLQQLNQFLEQKGIFSRYKVRPFVEKYPLHNTLYLTEYTAHSIPQVIDIIASTVSHWHQFRIQTDKVYITPQNYMMLRIAYKAKPNGLNSIIQNYSDEIVLKLMGIRDTKAPIPDWAQHIPSKKTAFARYGSPNVFLQFSPHFTLMAKKFKDKTTATQFQNDLNTALFEYQLIHLQEPIQLIAKEVALGYVNEFGQITHEIASFRLKN